MIKISIITICFNNLDDLLVTSTSVDNQTVAPFEHIIVNGSTQPAIEEYLQRHPQPHYRKWKSEKDNGISDAFNKGIEMASGELVLMLNAGDAFYNKESLQVGLLPFEKDPSLQWLHSKYELHRGHKWIIIGKSFSKKKLYRGMRSICHQTMFVKRELHKKYGLYDSSLKVAMDYDFLLRIAPEPFLFLKDILVKFAPGGTSSHQYQLGLQEMRQCYEKYYGKSWKLSLWQLRLRLIRWLMTTKLGKWLYRLKTGMKLENM